MTDIPDQIFMSPSRLRAKILEGAVTARQSVKDALDRIDRLNPDLNAFLSVYREGALERADALDKQLEKGENPGPLAGVPVAIKDNICVRNRVTTAGSAMLETFEPPYSATVVRKLRAAGAVIIGKTNMDEFAMGSSGENSAFGPTKNPRDRERVPGGSSSGSAAAVAAGMVPAALGSDTGGSIRQPASLCGVTGLKPTYGRVSRYGLIAFASSLDQIGPITRTAGEAARILSVIEGEDERDATSVHTERDLSSILNGDEPSAEGLRIGVPEEFFSDGVDREVRRSTRDAIDALDEAGAEVVDISLPHTEYGIPTYYLIATSEASSNLARYDGMHYGLRDGEPDDLIGTCSASREKGFGDEVKRRILLGTFSLSAGYYDAYYKRALKVRRLIKNDFERAFEDVDVIAGPTSPFPAFPLEDKIEDPLQLYLCDLLTVTCNLAGLPGVSVPCGTTDDNLPIGLQFISPAFDEDTLLDAAAAFQHTSSAPENHLNLS